ncbi:hypothetical protein D049_3430B, partial [Vibrio parahaemolyticus VPTS-2010]
AGY